MTGMCVQLALTLISILNRSTSKEWAVEKGDGTLDKDTTSHDDLFDAFRMSLQFWY